MTTERWLADGWDLEQAGVRGWEYRDGTDQIAAAVGANGAVPNRTGEIWRPKTLGPGMFTGLRVGVAAGKALAHARRLPMIGVASLDLLAFPLRHSNRRIVCALDAGRGEIFHASYRQSPGGVQRITELEVASPDDLASDLEATGEEVLLAGDGAVRYETAFDGVRRVELADRGEAYPLAGSLVQLAHAQALREEFVSPAELTPSYLRKPDAEINWTMRDGVER